ncbi:MAG: hypothetical protein V4719_24960 [Planctomycetota bacterium]
MFHPQMIVRLTHLWCGVAVLASAGCQTYSPYGYGNYPGNYGSPVYQQPGQPVPYGSPGMAPGTVVMPPPSGGFQGGYPPPGGMQGGYPPPGGFPGGGQSAPPFSPGAVTPATPYPNVPNGPLPQGADAAGDGFGPSGQFPGEANRPPTDNGRSVPNYNDPDSPAAPRRAPAATPGIGDEASFKGEINGAKRATDRLTAEDPTPAVRPGAALTGAGADDIQFAPPTTRTTPRTANRGIIQASQNVESTAQPQNLLPYGRAPNGQAWFRGLIDFDEQENLWYLIYNPEPDAKDPQGGMVTLVEHPHLNLMQGDDVVLVEGSFDPTELDRNGRPKYRPATVRRLVP